MVATNRYEYNGIQFKVFCGPQPKNCSRAIPMHRRSAIFSFIQCLSHAYRTKYGLGRISRTTADLG